MTGAILASVSDALASETDLVIIPDGDLYALPFAALKNDAGRHLIESHSISVVPSIGTLAELEKRRAATSAKLEAATVVGDPSFEGFTFRGQHLPPLPVVARPEQVLGQLVKAQRHGVVLHKFHLGWVGLGA